MKRKPPAPEGVTPATSDAPKTTKPSAKRKRAPSSRRAAKPGQSQRARGEGEGPRIAAPAEVPTTRKQSSEAEEPSDGDDGDEDIVEAAAEVVEESVLGDRRADPEVAPSAGSLTRLDPMAAYLREVQRHPLLTPEEEHALAVEVRRRRRTSRDRRAPRHREPAPRGEDRVRVSPRLQEHHGPRAGGQHRPHAGREALRPVPRREALVVRRVVDPRVHPAVHPEQLAPREARHDAGAAQAVLQPEQGEGASSRRWASSPRTPRLPSARRRREGGRRDGSRGSRAARSRSTRRSATPTAARSRGST